VVKKIAPSVVRFDDSLVTAGSLYGATVIAVWQIENFNFTSFFKRNSGLRNTHGRKQLLFS
jgi:hypothetical protein